MFPNSDAGSEDIRRVIELYRRPFMRIERNLPHSLYAGLMNVATAMVGNSSSGIIEAPLMGLPAVNVGHRQRDRPGEQRPRRSPDRQAILDAMRLAMTPEFRTRLSSDSPYVGDGRVSRGGIVEVLRQTPIDYKLLTKQIVY